MKHTQLIEAFGGYAELAAILNAPAQTVAAWKYRGTIPPQHFPDIVKHAKAHGIKGVTLESLHAARAKRKAGAA